MPKQFIVFTALVALVTISVAATSPGSADKHKMNLKVLPKDISHEDLEKIMRGFNTSLGVKCNFCHSKSATDDKKMDFASDSKPEKETTRDMMRMTLKINKKFFNTNSPLLTDSALEVSCVTCHHGAAHPGK